MRFFPLAVMAAVASGCSGVGVGMDDDGGTNDGGTNVAMLPDDAGIPCEITALIARRCSTCHGAPPTAGAPITLLTRADFTAKSPILPSQNEAQRSLARMADGTMPPGGGLGPTDLVTFDNWVTLAPIPVVGNDHRSTTMAPGLACISCHSGQNFAGQNPGGLRAGRDVYDYMGTVFRAPHEKDLCSPKLGVVARVEIYDLNNVLVVSMPVNSGGNFFGDASGVKPAKYKAKIITADGNRMMTTAQTSGDCNTCHTVAGTSDAPGRIFLP
jgi:hypothetical protein